MSQTSLTGREGEQAAADFLMAHGYDIVARRYRFGRAEVDLIARKGSLFCMVEVKTRSGKMLGLPQDAVSAAQQKRMLAAANAFASRQEEAIEIRFDIMAITKRQGRFSIEHLKNAFYHF